MPLRPISSLPGAPRCWGDRRARRAERKRRRQRLARHARRRGKASAFFTTYLGQPAAAAPAIVITPESDDYLIAVDIGAIFAPLKNAGISYDAAVVKFKAIEQDNGAWHIEQSDFPTLTAHTTAHTPQKNVSFDSTTTLSGLKNVMVIDPATSWIRSGEGSADKISIHMQAPGIEEAMDVGPLQASTTSTPSADGALRPPCKRRSALSP